MEFWLIVVFSLCLCLFLRVFFNFLSLSLPSSPPGPPRVPLIGSLRFLRKPFSELEPILRNLHAKYGPIISLPVGSRSAIFISNRSLAHQALIQNAAVFSDRPNTLATSKIFNSNQHNISSGFDGPTWRLLRRNLIHEFLNPTRIKSFSGTRKRLLATFLDRLKSDSESGKSITVIDHLRRAMFCLLVSMCFGEGSNDKKIEEIEDVQRRLMLNLHGFNKLNFWPSVTRIWFHKHWEELYQIRKKQEDVLIPLIRARKIAKEETLNKANEAVVSYVDTLFDLQLPDEKRKLNEDELVSICSEILIAGSDTTATALEWILANLVKYPKIQQRLGKEIRDAVGERDNKETKVREEDLMRLPYLKAVVLEGLRRHPPGYFVLPHAVSEDFLLNDYLIPKNGAINFMVAQIGLDPEVREDPIEFKPERFLSSERNDGEAFDITGRKEIKMMPFGVGRRMCPGDVLAVLHGEYFVANLVWSFEWKVSNSEVDLSEKQELPVIMKNPLQVYLSPRF
ncbi:cytochrome P450 89A2-like [Neltuma alba]|uniref:cytochrome P450 89A2-like n=1 Tax=Neltuma alba TaxID=207710 RepID=UPI0010A52E0C|nr:cytochrome P450 89A2-like [Prosopis alba]